MKNVWMKTLLLTIVVTLSSDSAYGQANAEIEQAYGTAIHHYFRGDLPDAIELFSSVIQLDPTNPRPYFFRGLAHWKAGRTLDGQRDFRVGAYWEAQLGDDARIHVCRCLERIQGPQRMEIETARREARLAMLKASSLNSDVTPAMYGTDIIETPPLKSWIDGAMSTTPAAATPAPDLDEDNEEPVTPPTIEPGQIDLSIEGFPTFGPQVDEILPVESEPRVPDLKQQSPQPFDDQGPTPEDLGSSSTRNQRLNRETKVKAQSSRPLPPTAKRAGKGTKKRPAPSINESAKLPEILDAKELMEELPDETESTPKSDGNDARPPQTPDKSPTENDDEGPFEEIPDGDDN